VTLPYLTTVGAPYFIRAGVGRDFKNVPPLIPLLRGLLAVTLMPSLRLALVLCLSLLVRSLFLFDLPLGLTLLCITLLL
jgi:hypothetical protein